jgi:hypothetical protein
MAEPTGIYAEFTNDSVEMKFLSEKEGRPIFEDREFVRIIIAGDRNSEVYREATDYDKERFHEVYDRFKRGMEGRDQIVGTPLKQWALMKPSQIRELEGIKIFTVEHLAALSDGQKQQLGMGSHELVAAAKAYLEAAKDSSAAAFYATENERLRTDIAAMQQQIAELAAQASQSEERRGPGRPPKVSRETHLEL